MLEALKKIILEKRFLNLQIVYNDDDPEASRDIDSVN